MISWRRVLISGERRTAHFRAHERRFVELQGSIWHPGAVESTSVKVLNLGLAGAGIASPALLRSEDRVILTILADSLLDPLLLAARVAWVQMPQQSSLVYAGLSFESPDRNALLTLFQLIGSLTY